MARIVFGTYMFRGPLGGMLSWGLQYLIGLKRLGHAVTVVEKATAPEACFDPDGDVMTDDPSTGIAIVSALLERFGLRDGWCFVDITGRYHGLDRRALARRFAEAELFIDGGTHGAFADEARASGRRVLIDGEPGRTQVRWCRMAEEAQPAPDYDLYCSNGVLVGTERSSVPTAGRQWVGVLNPVAVDLFDTGAPPPPGAAFTTVMNWQSHEPFEYEGVRYAQKDGSFPIFEDLPRHTRGRCAMAVAGSAPRRSLEAAGWRVERAHDVARTFDDYRHYIRRSRGEFSVAKQVFVAMRTGWFSDRSAAYLAAGRPVVLQDTGFGEVLPTGEGLFAVQDVQQAAAAIDAILTDPRRHAESARELARAHLSAERVMGGLVQTALEMGSERRA